MPVRRTIAAVTVIAVALGALAVAGGGTPSAAQSPQTLTVLLKDRGGTLVRHGKAKGEKLATGDGLVYHQDAFAESGARIGTLYVECTNLGAKAVIDRARLQCIGTYDLADGQIFGVGLFRFSVTGEVELAVTGATGSFRGATGPIIGGGKPPKGYDSVDVITLAA